MNQAEQETVVRRLFEEGWSSGDVDAPRQFMTGDVVLRDVVDHPEALRGWDAVRSFRQAGSPDVKVQVEEIFLGETGAAVLWMAYGQIADDRMGLENRGKWWAAEGMSRLEFRDDKVCIEVDYWHGPQGVVEDWAAHWQHRQQLSRAERGGTTGA